MSNHKQDMVNLAAKHCKTLGINPSEYDGDKLDDFYRKKCAEHHPDKGGNHEEFIKLKPARDWLRNNAKTALRYASEIRDSKKKATDHSSNHYWKKKEDFKDEYSEWEKYSVPPHDDFMDRGYNEWFEKKRNYIDDWYDLGFAAGLSQGREIGFGEGFQEGIDVAERELTEDFHNIINLKNNRISELMKELEEERNKSSFEFFRDKFKGDK